MLAEFSISNVSAENWYQLLLAIASIAAAWFRVNNATVRKALQVVVDTAEQLGKSDDERKAEAIRVFKDIVKQATSGTKAGIVVHQAAKVAERKLA